MSQFDEPMTRHAVPTKDIILTSSLVKRFYQKLEKTDSCWRWTGSVYKNGYGSIGAGRENGGTVRAHRLAWRIINGPLPKGALILHSCNNRLCVNPDHLYAGNHFHNARDRLNAGPIPRYGKALMTHCLRGHKYTKASTGIFRSGDKEYRKCMICYRERKARIHKELREQTRMRRQLRDAIRARSKR